MFETKPCMLPSQSLVSNAWSVSGASISVVPPPAPLSSASMWTTYSLPLHRQRRTTASGTCSSHTGKSPNWDQPNSPLALPSTVTTLPAPSPYPKPLSLTTLSNALAKWMHTPVTHQWLWACSSVALPYPFPLPPKFLPRWNAHPTAHWWGA